MLSEVLAVTGYVGKVLDELGVPWKALHFRPQPSHT
jgi:hypothetical protein